MPTDISPHAALIWFAVGLFTGLGWFIAAWLVGRLTRAVG